MLLETPLQGVLIFFCPTRIAPFGCIRERTDQQPTHIAAHFQAPTSQRSKPKACKRAAILPSHRSDFIIFEL